jgi:hypothetical protein
MNRVLAVARIQLISWPAYLWPVGIMLSSFIINVALFAAIGDQIPGRHVTGGLVSIYIVMMIACAQLTAQMFSLTVGLNATRRAYYLGTGLVFTGVSLLYGVLLYGFELVEHATNGWGSSLAFFDVGWITSGSTPLQILVYAVPMMLASAAGVFMAIVQKRWGGNGILALTLLGIIGFGGAAVLVTMASSWSDVWHWIVDQPGVALMVGWPLIPLVALAFGSYGLLRRAVP